MSASTQNLRVKKIPILNLPLQKLQLIEVSCSDWEVVVFPEF